MPKFEIWWKFVTDLTPRQAKVAVVLIRHRVPELANCQSEVTDNREPPNRIKLIAEGEFDDQKAAQDWADTVQGKVLDSQAISHLKPEYYMTISAPDQPLKPDVH